MHVFSQEYLASLIKTQVSMTIAALTNTLGPGLYDYVSSRSLVSVRLLIYSIFVMSAVWRLCGDDAHLSLCTCPLDAVLYKNAVRQTWVWCKSVRHTSHQSVN
jgi:hypothetical protein